jgi:hypothetical protein
VLVVEDREQLSSQIGPRLPKVLFGDCPCQAVLNQIIGNRWITRQRTCIAPKPRDLLFEEFTEIAHSQASLEKGIRGANSSKTHFDVAGR